jgi:hypothetical protein
MQKGMVAIRNAENLTSHAKYIVVTAPELSKVLRNAPLTFRSDACGVSGRGIEVVNRQG